MTKKKLTLNELKVKSIATSLNEEEQKSAKGGFFDDNGSAVLVQGNWNIWTVEKTGHRPKQPNQMSQISIVSRKKL